MRASSAREASRVGAARARRAAKPPLPNAANTAGWM